MPEPPSRTREPSPTGDEAGHRILVVDDNEMNRDMLSRRLGRKGFAVEVACDGREALAILEKQRFDAILLDIMMPDINGMEVLKVVREKQSAAELPILMVTAKNDSRDVIDALEAGANDYITKPIDFAIVLARLKNQLALARTSGGAGGPTADELITAGESATVEFKSTLRWNIREEKKDDEVTYASMKTIAAFLNSDGGTLLIGISDVGDTVGIELDRFDDADRFLRHLFSLINQSMGEAAASRVDATTERRDEKMICRVECRPAEQPVYLVFRKHDEAFYIRTGPASNALSPSQLVRYIDGRFDRRTTG